MAALLPVPPRLVEQYYASGLYPPVQHGLTALSNTVPFALFDVFCVVVALAWLVPSVAELLHRPRGWIRACLRVAVRTVVLVAALYVAFLVVWGLNYRRVPLADALAYDAGTVTPDAALALARLSVARLNALSDTAHAEGAPADAGPDHGLAAAFAETLVSLGVSRPVLPARPKTTLFDPYFKAASVEGMTAPYVAETLIVSDLLPVERPFVIAHEWSHLAGFAEEGDASFVGWLTCLHASAWNAYSGWLFMYGESVSALPGDERRDVAAQLTPGPRADLVAISERRQRNVVPTVSRAGWEVYDRYLKANRVAAGAASYGHVLQLVLGTELGRLGQAGQAGLGR